MNIVIAAGGSGGHVIPAEALALNLIKEGCEVVVLGHEVEQNPFFTSKQSLKKINIDASNFQFKNLPRFIFKSTIGFIKALKYFQKAKPQIVVGFGSYHSFPVLAAASILKIPMALYEANTVMGKVIKLFSKKAKLIACPFSSKETAEKFIQVKPLNQVFIGSIDNLKDESMSYFKSNPEKKTLLIIGGSQGSIFFNQKLIQKLLPILDQKKWQVIHLAGNKSDLKEIESSYKKYNIESIVKNYEKKMTLAYAASDLIISRSGASTLFEIAHAKKPVILVPYPHSSGDHQLLNADHFIKHHKGALIEELLLDSIDLSHVIDNLIQAHDDYKAQNLLFTDITLDKRALELCLKR
jgi:UDP-N-acetylglucosamine--N-acetylmuramyl-(pentapeptide) pyrophosphoryl-undecaprenol N-acetylglucosamine transferase